MAFVYLLLLNNYNTNLSYKLLGNSLLYLSDFTCNEDIINEVSSQRERLSFQKDPREPGLKIKKRVQTVKLAIENKDQRYLKMTVRQEPHPPHKTTLQNRGQEKKTKENTVKENKRK